MTVSNTEKPRTAYIDTLRGIAILGIFTAHAGSYSQVPASVQAYLSLGTIGVQLFFILSAYTLCLNYEASIKFNLRNFYIRRFIRIFPLFWLYILINLAFYGYAIRHHAPNGITGVDISLNFVGIGWLKPDAINGVVDGGWFIFSLLIFYILFPFLVKWKNNFYKILWLITVTLVAKFIYLVVSSLIIKFGLTDNSLAVHYGNFFYYNPINHFFSFLLGIFAYFIVNNYPLHFKYRLLFFVLSGILFFFFAKGGFNRISNNYIYSCVLLLVLLAFSIQELQLGGNHLLRFLGRISYSIFLNHLIVLDLLKSHLANIHFITLLLLSLLISILIAYLTYRVIEVWLSKKLYKLSLRKE